MQTDNWPINEHGKPFLTPEQARRINHRLGHDYCLRLHNEIDRMREVRGVEPQAALVFPALSSFFPEYND